MTNDLAQQNKPRRALIKKEARKCLYNDWIMRILAVLIPGACSVGIIQFGTALSLVLENVTGNIRVSALIYSVYTIFSLAVIIPLFYGLFYAYIKADEDEGKISISDLFYAFGSISKLFRSYRLFVYTALRLVVCFLPAIVVNIFSEYYYYTGFMGISKMVFGIDVVYFVLKSIFVLALFAGFVFGIKNIVSIYVSIKREDKEIPECHFVARICCEGSKRELAFCALSFLPLFAVSIFTFGFLFIMYTLPYMLITFTLYSKYLYKNEMHTKKASDVLYNDVLDKKGQD